MKTCKEDWYTGRVVKKNHYSQTCDNETSRADVKRLIREANHHANYHFSMTADNLIGISDLDRKAPIWDVSTGETIREMSLRQVL